MSARRNGRLVIMTITMIMTTIVILITIRGERMADRKSELILVGLGPNVIDTNLQ